MFAETAMRNGADMIRIEGVTRRFDAFTAVDDVSLVVRRGEVFGLIGHNGAGKSTLFKMMLGLLRPSAGQITIAGEAVLGPKARQVRRRIGYLPENVSLWDNLSGMETLRFFARLKRVDAANCEELLARVGLGKVGPRPVRAYSKGMRQRLGFAQALLGTPEVLFLDEPTTGLDPRATHLFWDILAELRERGLTIVLTSHVLAELQHRVDRVAVLTNGRIQALGTLPELRAAFDLPLTIRVQLEHGTDDAQARQLVEHMPHAGRPMPAQRTADALLLRAPRSIKRELLQYLLQPHGIVNDVQVDEPSLEDMFFGDQAPELLLQASERKVGP